MAFTAVSAFGQRWSNIQREKAWYRIFTQFITDSARKIMRLPMSFHNDNPISEIEQKMIRASQNLSEMFSTVFLELLPAFLGIGIATVALFSVNTLIAIIILISVAVYCIILVNTVGSGAKLQRENHKNWIKAWREQSDFLYNISTVKQFAAENFSDEKNVTNFSKHAFGSQLNLINMWKMVTFWQRVIVIVCQAVVLGVSIYFISTNTMTAGQAIAVNAYVGMMFGPFMRLGNMWRTIQNSIITITDAHEIFMTKEEDYDQKHLLTREIAGNISFTNITFYHDERKIILDEISLDVKSGQKIGLVGETGSGKTSLIELVYRFYLPKSGEIKIDGENIKKYNLTSLRSQIGVVPQDPTLFDLTILENITYPHKNIPTEKVRDAARMAELLDFIEEQPDKWDTIVGDRGVKLSGGQKQRVAIARAIINNPKILILDESTSALDAKTQRSIEKSLDYLMEGRTTLIVAHRLSAVRNADVICVLHKGKIVEQGSHDELMDIENGRYRTLYELQFQEKEIENKEEGVLS